MGMMDSAFWLSWGAWEFTLAFFTGNIIAIFGLILQFNLFLKNNYGLLFFLFFLFQVNPPPRDRPRAIASYPHPFLTLTRHLLSLPFQTLCVDLCTDP